MKHLLAYLLVRRADGSWEAGSHRSLEGLLAAWDGAPDTKACGIVHVGFWRPDSDEFENAAAGKPGRVILTEAAKWALPPAFRSSSRPCGEAGGLRLFEALSGWGYEKDEEPDHEIAPARDLATGMAEPDASMLEPWLREVKIQRPELWRASFGAGIADDKTYWSNEASLSCAERDELATIRYFHMAGSKPTAETILAGLKYAPPWLLEIGIDALLLSVRASNCLKSQNISSIAGIVRLGPEGVKKIPNMGAKSVHQIAEEILRVFHSGSAHCPSHASHHNVLPAAPVEGIASKQQEGPLEHSNAWTKTATQSSVDSFSAGLRVALSYCDEKEAKILSLRMGLHGKRQTLDSCGGNMSITRERVRQIEAKAVKKIRTIVKDWIERIEEGVTKALSGRSEPLPLLGLEIVDPWFAGTGDNEGPLEFAFEHFSDSQPFWLVHSGGQIYVTGISREGWAEALRKTKALLAELVRGGKTIPKDEAKCLAESMLSGAGEELRPLLWAEVTRWANFSKTPSGEILLASFGLGAESVVEAVLLESDRPLHYEEITRRCAARGKAMAIRRAHHAVAKIGILMAPGVFGLEKHFPLSDDETGSVVSEVENMLLEAPGKQWHTDEIVDALGGRGLDLGGKLNKYILNHALKSSKILAYLGRLVWAVKSGSARGKADRIGVWQAVVALLDTNGGPMRTEEIRNRLSSERGLGGTSLLLVQSDPLIRVGEGEWGLLWRDVPFSEKDADRLVEEMESAMEGRGEGLHTSEIVGALPSCADLASRVKDPVLLVALAARSGRMKPAKGGYVHPVAWEGPRRYCLSEAIEAALAEAGEAGWSLITLAARASGFLGRDIPSTVAIRLLISVGAVYDEERAIWCKPVADGTTLDEEDEAGLEDDAGEAAESCQVFPPSDGDGDSSTTTAQGV